jgi:hypothetical protein
VQSLNSILEEPHRINSLSRLSAADVESDAAFRRAIATLLLVRANTLLQPLHAAEKIARLVLLEATGQAEEPCPS